MKTKKLKIVVVENTNFYNQIIEEQISEILTTKNTQSLNFEITSTVSIDNVKNNNFQVILFDNHFQNNRQHVEYNVSSIIDEINTINNNCFFISISGYREMNISAYLYKEGKLQFTYSKQFAFKNQNYEDKCAIPAIQKLMERFIDGVLTDASKIKHRIAA